MNVKSPLWFSVLHLATLLFMTALFWIPLNKQVNAPIAKPPGTCVPSGLNPIVNGGIVDTGLSSNGRSRLVSTATKSLFSNRVPIPKLYFPHPSTLPPPPLPTTSLGAATVTSFSSFSSPFSQDGGLPPLPGDSVTGINNSDFLLITAIFY